MTWEGRLRMIEEQQASGQSVQRWCLEKGISYNTFQNWRKTVRRRTAGESKPSVVWADVSVSETIKTKTLGRGAIKIIRNGWTVTVETGCDSGLLTEVLQAVNRSCC